MVVVAAPVVYYCPCLSTLSKTSLKPSLSSLQQNPTPRPILQSFTSTKICKPSRVHYSSDISYTSTLMSPSETDSEHEESEYDDYTDDSQGEEVDDDNGDEGVRSLSAPPVRRRRRRYRKQYPGEKKGITEEMRFVAMKLRNNGKGKSVTTEKESEDESENDGDNNGGETWQPSMEGFIKYLVDSQLVFSTIERIVDESTDVSYVYFRKTGMERSESLAGDLNWLCEQGNVIPEPSNPGVTYAKYLEEIAEKSPPLFLCHFYNIYFSHIAGGQVIGKQVCDKILEGRKLKFYSWEGDAEELLKDMREKLNALAEHWSRDEKNKCLREATKAFRFLGQIVRLIVL